MELNKDTFTKEEVEELLNKETAKTRIATEQKLSKHTVKVDEYNELKSKYETLTNEVQEKEFTNNLQERYTQAGGNPNAFDAFKAQYGATLKEVEKPEEFNKQFSNIIGDEKNQFYFEKQETLDKEINKPTLNNPEKGSSNTREFIPGTTIFRRS